MVLPRTARLLMGVAVLVSLSVGILLSFFVGVALGAIGGLLLCAYLLLRIKMASDRLVKAAPKKKRRLLRNL